MLLGLASESGKVLPDSPPQCKRVSNAASWGGFFGAAPRIQGLKTYFLPLSGLSGPSCPHRSPPLTSVTNPRLP